MGKQYYRLQIQTGSVWTSYMSEELANQAFAEWKEWLEDVTSDEDATLILNGVTNDCNRDPHTVVLKMDSIQAMEMLPY